MKKQLESEVKVGIFVMIGIGLTMAAILILGSADNLLVRKNRYTIHFQSVEGLISGAKVVVGGLQVGTVEQATFDEAERNVKVTVAVTHESATWLRKDSQAEIATQGVLGDKFIMITPGTADQPELASGAEIPTRPGKDLSQFLTKGDQLMVSLNSLAGSLDRVFKAFDTGNRADIFFQGLASSAKTLSRELDGIKLKSAIGNLNAILEKINDGTGTVGSLINDPALYDDAKALVGGANRSRIVRNLVRQTIRKSEEAQAAAAAEAAKKPQ